MNKQEFNEYVDQFNINELTEKQILDICKKHKELKVSDRNWEELNTKLNKFKPTGEGLRCWCKNQLYQVGEVPENVMVLKADKKPVDLDNEEIESIYDKKMEQLRKERFKNQTLMSHKYREERQEARQDLFGELLSNSIQAIKPPKFNRYDNSKNNKEYMLSFGDIHYGAQFEVENVYYSIEECERRFNMMLNYTIDFIKEKKLKKINIANLGDDIQGILRLSDLKLNQISVSDAVVGVSALIASFLNELSKYCDITYYHICYSNHTQIRPLGTKANELGNEDLEKIIINLIQAYTKNNQAIKIIGDASKNYLNMKIFDFNICMCHGHNIKNIHSAIKDLSNHHRIFYDYLILGHTHSQKEYSCGCEDNHNIKILVAPSMVGLDPYSDSLLVSSKAGAVIFGFDEKYGQTEKYDMVLN